MAQTKRGEANPVLEYVAAAVGALIALGLLGLIGWDATQRSGPGTAVLAVVERRVVPAGHGFVVEVEVRNSGDATAAAVAVEGALKQGDAAVETSRTTLDYVPAGGSRRAALIFARDPAGHALELRATGYAEP